MPSREGSIGHPGVPGAGSCRGGIRRACTLERQEAIQKKLVAKHLTDGCLVLYDITSSYFEGEYKDSELVQFGYNRDKKKGHEQIVVGLMCTAEGCPVGCEVFPGNTNNPTTVMGKIAKSGPE